MKKLKLDVDALQVESFDPAADEYGVRGTVDGRQILNPNTRALSECIRCLQTADFSCRNSCMASCIGTCDASCYGTCGCPNPSENLSACCPLQTQYCDTRLCPVEDTGLCLQYTAGC